MAIFERFLRPTSSDLSPSGRLGPRDLEAHMGFNGKLSHPSPKVSNPPSGEARILNEEGRILILRSGEDPSPTGAGKKG
ncbi:hypothetical protein FF1_013852 [Malus domestica]